MAAVGRLQLHGTVLGRAYVHRRSPATAAGAAVKADLVASLRVRLEALRDEAELMQASNRHQRVWLRPSFTSTRGRSQACVL